jgi:hypothetical protein
MDKRNKSIAVATAMSQKKGPAAGCFLFVFFSIFFVVGSVFFFILFLRPLYQIRAARDWVETPCMIESSQVGIHSDSDGTSYSIDIVYKYLVDRQWHQSDRYSFQYGASSGREGKQRVVNRYPAGSEKTCYVDPDDPTQAVLNRDFVPGMWFGLFPLIFVAAGGGGLLFVFWGVGRGKRRGVTSQTEWLPDDEQRRVEGQPQPDYTARAPSGPVTLKPVASPWGKLAGALLFAVFWNGITSIFVTIAVTSHLKGRPEWFLTIFIIPFVLVGLGMILYVGYTLLALFTPQPVVRVSSRSVRLGDLLVLNWTFGGSSRSIRQMNISVSGREEATYRRGTKTHTDTKVFREIPVVETDHFLKIQQGEAEIRIPEDTMHSFESAHNKIVWTIQVKGEISMWPDVDNSYTLLVLPLGPDAGARR